MSRNRLNHLPGELGSLPALTSLDLSHNHISSVPEQLGSATALTALNLMGNRLTQLPDSIGQLTNLRWVTQQWWALISDLGSTFAALCALAMRKAASPSASPRSP